MTDSKDLSEQDAVVAEVEIAAPLERVFEALTEADQLFAWWSTEPSVELSLFEMDARVGGRWRFKGRPAPGSDHGDVGEQLKRNAAFALAAKAINFACFRWRRKPCNCSNTICAWNDPIPAPQHCSSHSKDTRAEHA